MMTPDTWRSSLIAVIREFADEEFQERIWRRGAGPEVSSWDEAMNRLYDDCMLDQVINGKYDLGLSSEQLLLLDRLHREVVLFSESVDERPKPSEVLESPAWLRVRESADAALKALLASRSNGA